MHKAEPDANHAVVPQTLGDAELYNTLVGHLEEGIYMVDRSRRIHYWNSAAEKITGYYAHEVVERLCDADLLMHRDSDGTLLCEHACPLSRVMQDGRPHECKMLVRHRKGHCVPVRARALPVHGIGGQIIGAVEVFEEMAAPGRAEWQSLEPCGCLDKATGAADRRYGEYHAGHLLAQMETFGIPFGWMRIELDGAERLEHRFGHGMIDAAMKLIFSTVNGNLASLDVLARWSSTEFRAAVHNCTHPQLVELARRLVMLVRCASLEWWGDPLPVTVSIGGGLGEPGDSLQSLESRAGETCAASRAAGGDRATLAHYSADDPSGTLFQRF